MSRKSLFCKCTYRNGTFVEVFDIIPPIYSTELVEFIYCSIMNEIFLTNFFCIYH